MLFGIENDCIYKFSSAPNHIHIHS